MEEVREGSQLAAPEELEREQWLRDAGVPAWRGQAAAALPGARRWVRGMAPFWSGNRAQQLLVRDVVVLSIGLALPFVPSVVQLAKGYDLFIPIVTLILVLTPEHATNVGAESNMFLQVVLVWLCLLAWLHAVALPLVTLAGAFVAQFAVAIFTGVMVAYSYPTWILPVVMGSVVFSVLTPSIFSLYHFGPEDGSDALGRTELDAKVREHIAGVAFSFLLPLSMHALGALLIFPWWATNSLRRDLVRRWQHFGTLLNELQRAYDAVALYTMYPERQTSFLFLEDGRTADLQRVFDEEIAISHSILSMQLFSLFETRWGLSGAGVHLIRLHVHSLRLNRQLLNTADDLLQKYARLETFARESSPGVPERVLQREIALEAPEAESAREVKEAVLLALSKLLGALGRSTALATAVLEGPLCAGAGEPWTTEHLDALAQLASAQDEMEELEVDLRAKTMVWARDSLRARIARFAESSPERLNRDEPLRRTLLMSFVLTLNKAVEAQRRFVDYLTATADEVQGLRRRKRGVCAQLRAPLQEWRMSVLEDTDGLSPLDPNTLYAAAATRGQGGAMLERMEELAAGVPFRMAVKFTVGTVLLIMPAMLESTRESYSQAKLASALFTFQVILYKLQMGLVLERTLQRIGGILLGYVYASLCWQVVCAAGDSCTPYDGWSYYVLALPAMAIYLWVSRNNAKQGYFAFAFVRTYATQLNPWVALARSNAGGDLDLSPEAFWRDGGLVVLASLLGAAIALILGTLVWPTSGRASLRELLARIYHELMLYNERIIFFYQRERPSSGLRASPVLELAETRLARSIFLGAGPLLRAAELETVLHVNFDAPHEQYVAAVESAKQVWRCLLKLHYVGGIQIRLTDEAGVPMRTVSPASARALLNMNRLVSGPLSLISCALASRSRRSIPVLRPVVATPHLLSEQLHDYLVICYRDEKMMDYLLRSNDLGLLLNLVVLQDILIDMSHALDTMYGFLERFLRVPRIREELLRDDAAAFSLYDVNGPEDKAVDDARVVLT